MSTARRAVRELDHAKSDFADILILLFSPSFLISVSVFQSANGLETGAVKYLLWDKEFVKIIDSAGVWLAAARAHPHADEGSPEVGKSVNDHKKRMIAHLETATRWVEQAAEVVSHWCRTQQQVRHTKKGRHARAPGPPCNRCEAHDQPDSLRRP